jgi:hypothetical protein
MGRFNDDTCFLFADPSFISGWAAMLDFAGTLNVYNESRNGQEADYRALASDWAIVGKDLKAAADKLGENEKSRAQTA